MVELAVLHPQDCLTDRLPHMNPRLNPNPNSTGSNRRKRSLEKKKNHNNITSNNFPAKKPVMGQVKILKRGEELMAMKNRVDEKKAAVDSDDLVVVTSSSTDRLVAEPVMVVPKQLRLGDFYAGSAIFSSPPPSSLPLPAFFTKKSGLCTTDDATTDLRRLLRLDLL